MMPEGVPPGIRGVTSPGLFSPVMHPRCARSNRSRERSRPPVGRPDAARGPAIKASPACSDHTVSESRGTSRIFSAPPKFRAKSRPQVSDATERDRNENRNSPTQSVSVSVNNHRPAPGAPRFNSPRAKQEPRQSDGDGANRYSPQQHRARHEPYRHTDHDRQAHRARPAQSDARSGSMVRMVDGSGPSHPRDQPRAHPKQEPFARDNRYPNTSARPAASGATFQDRPAPSRSFAHTAGPSGTIIEDSRGEKEEHKVHETRRAPKPTQHLSSREVESYQKMHFENQKYMCDYDRHKPDTSKTAIFIAKRGDVSGYVLEKGCRLIEEKGYGYKAAANEVGCIIGELRDYWNKVYKHNADHVEDDDDDSDSQEIGAVPADPKKCLSDSD